MLIECNVLAENLQLFVPNHHCEAADRQRAEHISGLCHRGLHTYVCLVKVLQVRDTRGRGGVKLTRSWTTFISDYWQSLSRLHSSPLLHTDQATPTPHPLPWPSFSAPRVIFRSLQPLQSLSRNQPGWNGEKAWVWRRPWRGGLVLQLWRETPPPPAGLLKGGGKRKKNQ